MIYLSNWSHKKDGIVGGVETTYTQFKKIFPNSKFISGHDFSEGCITAEEVIANVEHYFLKQYKKDKNMLIIRDAEFGGALDTSKILQIAKFGNPYKAINEKVGRVNKPWAIDGYIKNLLVKKKVAVSNFMKEEMKKMGLTADEVIHIGVDTSIFKPMNKKKMRKKYNIPNIKVGVWMGIANEVKNFNMLVKMIELFPNIFWIIISKVDLEPSKRFSNVKLFCKVSSKKVAELLNCGDFFILTSPVEGFGISWAESMACNVPIIASKAGYFWDFWDERLGIQVDHDDLRAHYEAIQNITHRNNEPKKVFLEQGLNIENWKTKWKKLVKDVQNDGI